MKQPLLSLLIFLLFMSCKPSEARLPVSNNSGTFIDTSVQRNKQLNKKESLELRLDTLW